MAIVPNFIKDCDCSTENSVEKESDGIAVKYTCKLCGDLLAELTIGAGD
jgi:hypothetical protein